MSTLRQRNKTIYWAWKAMKQRCLNPKCHAYKNYGARGITVCEEWMKFEPFCEWALSNGYVRGLDLDRKDNSGNYTPENCRWVSRRENVNNRRKTIYLTVNGERKPRTEWERNLGLPSGRVKDWVEKHSCEYAESRLAEILVSGYVERDYGYSHRRAMRNVESGVVYRSMKEAARSVGVGVVTIITAMKQNRSTYKGTFVWEDDRK